jgi:hypothetical protein
MADEKKGAWYWEEEWTCPGDKRVERGESVRARALIGPDGKRVMWACSHCGIIRLPRTVAEQIVRALNMAAAEPAPVDGQKEKDNISRPAETARLGG